MLRRFGIIGQKMNQIWAWLTAGTGGQLGFWTPSKVRSQVLVCWLTAISVTSFTKNQAGPSRLPPPPPLKGCYFHSNQALFRNLQVSGFATEYNDRESPISRNFNFIGCLPFVPAQSVQEIWSYLRVTDHIYL